MAPCFPFFATLVKERAVSGERPAVMQRPDDGDVVGSDVVEEKTDVEVETVEIVKVEKIWPFNIKPAEEAASRNGGGKAAASGSEVSEDVEKEVRGISNADAGDTEFVRFRAASVGRKGRVACGFR